MGPQAGLRCELSARNLLGRSVDAVVSLEDESVSRNHAEIRQREDGMWEIEDLGSRNGIRVNDEPTQRRDLFVGDKIQLGPNVLLLFTDQSQVEDTLIERQKFELLGRIAAGIAHDFNNVLGVLGASTGYLRGLRSDPASAKEQSDCLDDMEAAVANGARLVNRLVGFARGSQHGRSVVDVSGVCLELAQMCRRAFGSGIRIELNVERDLRVVADQGELEQVLMNLCVNARDSMPSGGTLTIRACERSPNELVSRHLAFSGPHVLLTVEDTGSGIDPSHLPRIFEPFFTTKGSGTGFGVGLATVKELVILHGGAVDVECKQGGTGTMFHVFLPSAHDRRSLRVPVPTQASPLQRLVPIGRRVLLIDDDELVRRSTRRLLSRVGFEVFEASNGADGLRVYTESKPNVVLLDLEMPGLSGLETLSELKKLDPEVRVLVVSGHREPANEQAVRAEGAGFLGKPFDPAELMDAVRIALLEDSQHEGAITR